MGYGKSHYIKEHEMKKLVIAVAAGSLVLVGCTTEAEGTAVKAAEVVTVTQMAPPPPVTVAPAPVPRNLRQKLAAIPGVTAVHADFVLQLLVDNPRYEKAIKDGCDAGVSREFFVSTALEGAEESGPVYPSEREIMTELFGTVWDHYCPPFGV